MSHVIEIKQCGTFSSLNLCMNINVHLKFVEITLEKCDKGRLHTTLAYL